MIAYLSLAANGKEMIQDSPIQVSRYTSVKLLNIIDGLSLANSDRLLIGNFNIVFAFTMSLEGRGPKNFVFSH